MGKVKDKKVDVVEVTRLKAWTLAKFLFLPIWKARTHQDNIFKGTMLLQLSPSEERAAQASEGKLENLASKPPCV